MYTNADCTLYLYNKEKEWPSEDLFPSRNLFPGIPHDHEGRECYIRVPVYGVYWEDVRQSSFLRTGQRNAVTALVVIPVESLGTKMRFTQGKDLIVKGVVEDEIDCTDQITLSRSLAALKASYDYLTTMSVDERLYGSESVQHYELSCK